jgi:hypothetical protein
LLTEPSNLLELQLPAILDMPAWQVRDVQLSAARAAAAQELSSLAVMPATEAAAMPPGRLPFVVPVLAKDDPVSPDLLGAVRMVELEDGPDVADRAAALRRAYPRLVVACRVALRPTTAAHAVELARAGLGVLHLCADQHGREHVENGKPGRHLKDALREIHGRFVKDGLRDEVTLVVGGGIALPEHMAKAILCGADLVSVDTPLLVALGCRVCRNAHAGCSEARCPAELGTKRMVNLMGAWHSQLIEVLGAMGIREVRRLRGEVGRAMFLEDIEKDAFGDIPRVSRAELRT